MFTLMEVECLGACDRAPVVMVNDDWHERLSPEQAGRFVDDIKAKGQAAFTGLSSAQGEGEGRLKAGPHGCATWGRL